MHPRRGYASKINFVLYPEHKASPLEMLNTLEMFNPRRGFGLFFVIKSDPGTRTEIPDGDP
jgi:hypothetical protein